MAGDLKDGENVFTAMNGKSIFVTKSAAGVTVENNDRSIKANVVKPDVGADNGVAHVIDAVLLPKVVTTTPAAPTSNTLVDVVKATDILSTLLTAVSAADLAGTLSGAGPFTVFAPTNDAFAALPADTLASLLKPENKAQLADILTYHVVAAKAMAGDLKDGENVFTAMNGKSIFVTKSAAGVTVENNDRSIKANVVKPDVGADNGVAHVIDAVLLPKVVTTTPGGKNIVTQSSTPSSVSAVTTADPSASKKDPPSSKKSDSNTPIIIIAVVAVLVLVAIAAFVVLRKGSGGGGGDDREAQSFDNPMYDSVGNSGGPTFTDASQFADPAGRPGLEMEDPQYADATAFEHSSSGGAYMDVAPTAGRPGVEMEDPQYADATGFEHSSSSGGYMDVAPNFGDGADVDV